LSIGTLSSDADRRVNPQVLKQCGDELSRENAMCRRKAEERSCTRKNTGPTDFRPIKEMQLITCDGKQWVGFGEVIANKPVSAP